MEERRDTYEEGFKDGFRRGHDTGYRMGFKTAYAYTRWIPVEERLPETPGKYLVTVKNGNVYAGTFDKISGKFQGAVTAWMPLPTPYLEGAVGPNGLKKGAVIECRDQRSAIELAEMLERFGYKWDVETRDENGERTSYIRIDGEPGEEENT